MFHLGVPTGGELLTKIGLDSAAVREVTDVGHPCSASGASVIPLASHAGQFRITACVQKKRDILEKLMRFLTGSDIQEQVRKITSRSGEVMVAVAYWGKGAAERTGLSANDNSKNVRIICDLLSGACNPAEIETLTQLGFRVRTRDRLHAKVWIGGDDTIVGSANASANGLPGEDEQAANASIEAVVVSHNPRLARDLRAWFEQQWCASSRIEDRHLDQARQLWKRRRRSIGRGFAATLTENLRNPGPLDKFHSLRLLAYRGEEPSKEAKEHMGRNALTYFTDDEWQDFAEENPWYEWPSRVPEWQHLPGTVFADFTCSTEGGEFAFNGFWQIRDCPSIKLKKVRLTLLTRLPHFNGYSLIKQEQREIALRIRERVAQLYHETDEFGSYIDTNFLEFWDPERAALHQRLVTQVVEAAQELCRTGQFGPSLTLQAIRACKKDPEWLVGYTRFVGSDIYGTGNPLKQQINPDFGRRVKAGVSAKDQEDENRKPVRQQVKDEIIQSYTLFRDYARPTDKTP